MSALDSTLSVLFLILSYLIGSIPFGLIFGKAILNIDIRQYGSKNIGSTNAILVLGKKIGYLVFLCDVLKGMIIIILLKLLNNIWQTPIDYIYYGAMAIIGHCFPIYLGFKGGKGVATGLGLLVFLMPKVAGTVFLVWLVLVLITRFVSLGSIVAAILTPIMAWYFCYPCAYIILGAIAGFFVVLRHKDNIGRLLNGTESKIKPGSAKNLPK